MVGEMTIRIEELLQGSINRCVSWYLMASYMYYVCDQNIMPDGDYDELGKRIIAEWDNITHRHKKFLTLEVDESNNGQRNLSGFNIEEYPLIVQSAAHQVYREMNPVEEKVKKQRNPKRTLF